MTTYPTKDKIEEIFSDRDLPDIFNTYLSDHVDLSVVGGGFHLAGHFKSKEAFHEAVYIKGTSLLKLETLRVEVNRVIGGGDDAWAAVYSTATAVTKRGKPYRNEFVDLVRFNTEGKIAQLREFFDTKELHDHYDEHTSEEKKTETETEGA